MIKKNKQVPKFQIPNQQYKCICQQTTWNHCEIIFICWTFHFVLLCIWQSMNLRSQQNNSIVVLHFHLSSGCPSTGRKPRGTSSRGRSHPSWLMQFQPQSTTREPTSGLWLITVVATRHAMSSIVHEPTSTCM